MACITGDSSNIFINFGNLVMSQDVYAGALHLGNDTFNFNSNIVIGQSGTSIAIGNQAGLEQQEGSIAIGAAAGWENQQEGAVAIGQNAGDTFQGTNAVAIGVFAGSNNQTNFAVAIGSAAGSENQGLHSIAIGRKAGENNQHSNTIVLNATGESLDTSQEDSLYVAPIRQSSDESTFLSYSSNLEIIQSSVMSWDGISNITTTSTNFVTQNLVTHNIIYASDIIIGEENDTSTTHRIAIGNQAGITGQNVYSIAMGHYAGSVNQGPNTIAIGPFAGQTNQHSNTIILNTNGSTPLNSQAPDSTYIYPIRQVPAAVCQVMGYDATTSEVLQTSSITVMNSNVGISNATPGYPFVVGNQHLIVGTNGHIGVNAAPNNAQMTIVNSNGTHTVLAVSGTSDQTANLQTWSNTNGTVVASMSNIGGLTIAGPLARKAPVTVSGTYEVKPTDSWILANTAAAVVTLILPAASSCPGRELTIRRLQAADKTHHVQSIVDNVYRMEHTTNPAIPQNIILEDATKDFGLYWSTLVSDGAYWWQMAGDN